MVLPIRLWSDDDVWAFLRWKKVPYCKLYDEGFHRLGCIGCPMARRSGRLKEFARWPGFEKRWKLAVQRLWDRRVGTAQKDGREWCYSAIFKSWEGLWEWWLSDKGLPKKGDLFKDGDT